MKPEIDLLVDFVNTHDLEEETDSIADPARLAAWIAERTGEHLPELQADDVARLQDLRESIRALMHTNNGGEVGKTDLEPLREAAERSRFRLAFEPDGGLELTPARADLSGFESSLLLALEHLQCHEVWPR